MTKKYIAISGFFDKHSGEHIKKGDPVEADDKRAAELKEKGCIKDDDGTAVKRVDAKVAGAEAQKIIDDAKAEAQKIIDDAKSSAVVIIAKVFKVDELKAKAKDIKIDNYTKMTESELAEAIVKASAE